MPCSLTPPRSVIFESDVGSLGSSSIDIPSPIRGATGAISGPSTDSSSERSLTGIGSLSGTISLRKYEDDDDDIVLLGSSTMVPSLLSKNQRFKPSIDPRYSDTACDTPNPATRSTTAE
ncbi:hypothetical protein M9H77_16417 [Catharanthus roseus]|uniref:Uncharacterized protein n=1 Tax=Catharanthus roseus TaxID=4058 RepID=A0ACC0B1Q0_CATRO|nr:hypothetical protein M9H77_16417 [Catharanthus roseus]